MVKLKRMLDWLLKVLAECLLRIIVGTLVG